MGICVGFVSVLITLCPLSCPGNENWLLYFYFRCLVTVNVLWHFLAVPWVGLQCVIVLFPIMLTYFWY